MNNQAKNLIQQGILGDQAENPYGNMAQMQPEVDHQAAFEEQMRKNNAQQQVQQQQITQQQVVPQQNQDPNEFAFEENGTYCRTGSFEKGFIETDLKIVKEKGVEARCVSFSVISNADKAELYEENNIILVKMEMISEEQFNNFKRFIANLNWND